MAKNQKYKERRVNTLPTSGLFPGDKYHLNVGADKYQTWIVSDALKLTKEAGAEFIEKDTMAEMRALSSREIWALQQGYYKGVKLNGYYAKGDTPAPIEYYLSDTIEVDDGGAIITINGVKLIHYFNKEVNILYYGAVKNSDISNNLNKAQNYLNSQGGGNILIPNGDYKITESFIYKDFIGIKGIGDVTITAINPMEFMFGTLSKLSTMKTLPFTRLDKGSYYIDVSNDVVEGDLLRLKSNLRFTRDWDDGNVVRDYYVDGEMLEVRGDTTNSRIYFKQRNVLSFLVENITDFDYFTPNKGNSFDNITLIQYKDDVTYSSGLVIRYCSDFKVGKIKTYNTNSSGVLIASSFRTTIESFYGKGGTPLLQLNYGIQISNGSKYTNIIDLDGENYRHTFASGGSGFAIPFFADIVCAHSKNSFSHGIDCHDNSGFFTFHNIFSDYAFVISGIGHSVLNAISTFGGLNFVGGGKDMFFGNIKMLAHAGMRTVAEQGGFYRSYNNCYFDNIYIEYRPNSASTYNTYWRTEPSAHSNYYNNVKIVNSMYNASLTPAQNLSNLYGYTLFVMHFNDNDYVNRFVLEGWKSGVNLRGKNIMIEKLEFLNTCWGGTGSASYLIGLSSGAKDNTIERVVIKHNTPVDMTSTNILRSTIGNTENIKIKNINGLSSNVFDYNIFITAAILNLTLENWKVNASLQPQQIDNATLNTLKSYNVVGVQDTKASITKIGLVNQALAQANISQAALAAISTSDGSDAATTQALANAIKAYINANVVPLVNALRASQNTELENQRTAGQQAP